MTDLKTLLESVLAEVDKSIEWAKDDIKGGKARIKQGKKRYTEGNRIKAEVERALAVLYPPEPEPIPEPEPLADWELALLGQPRVWEWHNQVPKGVIVTDQLGRKFTRDHPHTGKFILYPVSGPYVHPERPFTEVLHPSEPEEPTKPEPRVWRDYREIPACVPVKDVDGDVYRRYGIRQWQWQDDDGTWKMSGVGNPNAYAPFTEVLDEDDE